MGENSGLAYTATGSGGGLASLGANLGDHPGNPGTGFYDS